MDKPADSATAQLHRDAVKSASKQMQVLVLTMGLSLLLKMYMPRILGVDKIGLLYTAEAFPVLFFVFLNCGIDTYIRRTIPGRPEHLPEILWPVVLLQLGLAALIMGVMAATLVVLHYDSYVILITLIMGGSLAASSIHRNILRQAFISLKQIRVTSNVEIAVKVYLVATTAIALFFSGNLVLIAGLTASSEAMGALYLALRARRQGLLRWVVDGALLKAILWTSLPFLATTIFIEIYGSIGTNMLARLAGTTEVGFFGAAVRLKWVFLLFIPVMSNAFMPLMAQTYALSRAKYADVVKGFVRTTMILAFFLTVGQMVFADVATTLLYGAAFANTARIVAYLGPSVPLTYLAVLLGMNLTITSTGRSLALVQCLAIASDVVLNIFFIKGGAAYWGAGGAGAGVALASVLSQGVGTFAMLFLSRGNVDLLDRKMLRLLAVHAVPYGLCLVFFDQIVALALGPRIGIFLLCIVVYSAATGLVTRADVRQGWELARHRRR